MDIIYEISEISDGSKICYSPHQTQAINSCDSLQSSGFFENNRDSVSRLKNAQIELDSLKLQILTLESFSSLIQKEQSELKNRYEAEIAGLTQKIQLNENKLENQDKIISSVLKQQFKNQKSMEEMKASVQSLLDIIQYFLIQIFKVDFSLFTSTTKFEIAKVCKSLEFSEISPPIINECIKPIEDIFQIKQNLKQIGKFEDFFEKITSSIDKQKQIEIKQEFLLDDKTQISSFQLENSNQQTKNITQMVNNLLNDSQTFGHGINQPIFNQINESKNQYLKAKRDHIYTARETASVNFNENPYFKEDSFKRKTLLIQQNPEHTQDQIQYTLQSCKSTSVLDSQINPKNTPSVFSETFYKQNIDSSRSYDRPNSAQRIHYYIPSKMAEVKVQKILWSSNSNLNNSQQFQVP